ncbi:MAG: DUF3800 domain-containing protein [Phycisphaerae bacterium]|nr:DUF3800 domain-containing protein [Phycisphaerae bacterium]
MLVFVDESGDAGMKPDRQSSPYFVVTAVLFEDHEEAQACDRLIDKLRGRLEVGAAAEFHFSKSRRQIREQFLQHAARFGFSYLAVVLNKRKLTGPGFRYKSSFYKYTVNLVFQNAKAYLRDAIVVLDRSGGEEFRAQLARYLAKKVNAREGPKAVRKVKTERSHNNNLLQACRHGVRGRRTVVSGRQDRPFCLPPVN